MKLFLLALAVTAVTECCDQQHPAYVLAAENVELCKAKGGIASIAVHTDDGGHVFTVLTGCALPCGPSSLQGEKP